MNATGDRDDSQRPRTPLPTIDASKYTVAAARERDTNMVMPKREKEPMKTPL